MRRAVVANADAVEGFVSEDPPPEGAYARGAATMLMGSDGIVPEGAVSRALLRDDPDAPFGRRLDRDKVLTAVDATWADAERAVVLVEASDLSRVAAYGSRATATQRRALRDEALADADALLGALLERIDPERDAVVVLSPVSPSASPTLGMVAVQAPGVDGGLLESATTRRDGYVQLADVAPTVLRLLGEDPPSEMEGRAFQVTAVDGRPHGRARRRGRRRRVPRRHDGPRRDRHHGGARPPGRGHAVARPPRPRACGPCSRRWATRPWAWCPGTFVVGRVGAARANLPAQALIALAVAAAVAAACVQVDRRRPGWGAPSRRRPASWA